MQGVVNFTSVVILKGALFVNRRYDINLTVLVNIVAESALVG